MVMNQIKVRVKIGHRKMKKMQPLLGWKKVLR
jgi:hypothetical protein